MTPAVIQSNIHSLFENQRLDNACEIGEWFLAYPNTAIKVSNSDEIAIRLGQVAKTQPMEPLEVKDTTLNYSGNFEMTFSIRVYIGGTEN